MPSVPSLELLTPPPMIPYVTYFHGASCSHHRLKRLEKGDRRGNLS